MAKIAECLCDLSIVKYEHFVKVINNICIESAEKGNVHLIFTKNELDSINFPISEYSFKTIKVFLQQEGLVVVSDYDTVNGPKIEIYWVDLVINKKTDQILGGENISTKFPSIDDEEVRKLLKENSRERNNVLYTPNSLCGQSKKLPKDDLWDGWGIANISEHGLKRDWSESEPDVGSETDFLFDGLLNVPDLEPNVYPEPDVGSETETESESDTNVDDESDDNVFDIIVTIDDVKSISNMSEFIKTHIDKANNTTKFREMERIIYKMLLTILIVENEEPVKNEYIFKNKIFIDNLINKLNEMMIERKMHWPVEMIIEFEKIKRNRELF